MPEADKSIKKIHVTRLFIAVLALMLLTGGFYMFFLVKVAPASYTPQTISKTTTPAVIPDKQLIIPHIGVRSDIAVDNPKLLDKGLIVQRTKAGGDPEKGGNFVLTGHRFKMAWTPRKVQQSSVLYNLDKLKSGDNLTVYWNGKEHDYTVSRLYKVKPDQVEVEAPSAEAKLTIYTCTLGGTYDGRVVVEALPV